MTWHMDKLVPINYNYGVFLFLLGVVMAVCILLGFHWYVKVLNDLEEVWRLCGCLMIDTYQVSGLPTLQHQIPKYSNYELLINLMGMWNDEASTNLLSKYDNSLRSYYCWLLWIIFDDPLSMNWVIEATWQKFLSKLVIPILSSISSP